MAHRVVGLSALAALSASACSPGQPPRPVAVGALTAVVHVAVAPMDRDTLLLDQTLLVRGNRIVALADARSVTIPDGARVIQGAGNVVIPGLWDMHVHAIGDGRESMMLPALVAAGVTGVRNMHTVSSLSDVAELRRTIRRGDLVGPRLVVNGPLIDGPHPYQHRGSLVVSDSARARVLVDSLVAGGADFIKVYSGLSRDVYFAIAAEAARLHVPFAGHLPNAVTPVEAAAAGQRSVEHLDGLLRDCLLPDGAREPQCLADIEAYRAHHTWQAPTLALYRGWLATDSILADPETAALVSLANRQSWRAIASNTSAEGRAKSRSTLLRSEAIVACLRDARVPLLAGTDLGNPNVVPGYSLITELLLLRESGLTPFEALQTATINPAEYLGASDSLGTIAVGKLADFVLVGSDPRAHLEALRDVRAVMLDGKFYDRRALDGILGGARAAADVH